MQLQLQLQLAVLTPGIKAGTGFLYVWQVSVTEDLSLWVLLLQSSQQLQQSLLLCFCPCVGRLPLFVQATLVADTERMFVIAFGVGTDELFMARLVCPTVASDVVVITRETEAVSMTADESYYRERAVTARGTTMHDNEIDSSHDRQQLEAIFAALHKERADDGCEYGDNKLDNSLPSFHVFENLHNNLF